MELGKIKALDMQLAMMAKESRKKSLIRWFKTILKKIILLR